MHCHSLRLLCCLSPLPSFACSSHTLPPLLPQRSSRSFTAANRSKSRLCHSHANRFLQPHFLSFSICNSQLSHFHPPLSNSPPLTGPGPDCCNCSSRGSPPVSSAAPAAERHVTDEPGASPVCVLACIRAPTCRDQLQPAVRTQPRWPRPRIACRECEHARQECTTKRGRLAWLCRVPRVPRRAG
jgi:hypothetical protein